MTQARHDRRVNRLLDRAVEEGQPQFETWRPHPVVSFGPRDAAESGYDEAVAAATSHGYSTLERDFGGRAIAAHEGCISFIFATPDPSQSIEARYRTLSTAVIRAIGNPAISQGTLDRSFCPGAHSLIGDGKVAGFAQRVRTDAAAVGGIVIVRDHESIAQVLSSVYDALDLPFEPGTVGSLQHSGSIDTEEAFDRRLGVELAKVG